MSEAPASELVMARSTRLALLKPSELEDYVSEGSDFAAKVGFCSGFDSAHFITTWSGAIRNGIGFINARLSYGVDGLLSIGMKEAIGVMLYPDAFDGARVAAIMFWYHSGDASLAAGRLFADTIQKISESGARRVYYASLVTPRFPWVANVLHKAGFRALEVTYVKDLCQPSQ